MFHEQVLGSADPIAKSETELIDVMASMTELSPHSIVATPDHVLVLSSEQVLEKAEGSHTV